MAQRTGRWCWDGEGGGEEKEKSKDVEGLSGRKVGGFEKDARWVNT